MLKDLTDAKIRLLSKRKDEQGSSVYKQLNKKDYVDYSKYQNFNELHNEEMLMLNSVEQDDKDMQVNSKAKKAKKNFREQSQPRKTANQFDLQHQQIKKIAEQQLNLKSNKFENQFLNNAKCGMNELINSRGDVNDSQNFEILTKYLIYRQEVIAQSIGGQNIYQVTITKK